MSRRTFFRHFKGKEDVVVWLFSTLAEDGCAAFVARPPAEDLWTSLRYSFDPFIDWASEDPDRALALLRMIDETPSLRASYLERADRWRGSLADVIVTSPHGPPQGALTSPLRAAVIAGAGIGAFLAGTRAWVVAPGATPIAAVFDDAFAALRGIH